MPPYNFMGLSGLGMTQPSASSSVDNAQGQDMLKELLGGGNQILDETAKSRVLEQVLAQQNEQPTPTALDKLLSPQGLIALLGTLGAGAAGGAPAAAGFGLGALSNAGVAAEADRAQKRKAIDELEKSLEQSQDRLDKSRNRIATLFNTNPEAFVDPTTGEQKIAPDVLGFYTTGTPVELFATTRRALNRNDDATLRRHNLLTDNLKSVTDPNDRRVVLDAIFQNMGFKAPAELTTTLANATPESITPEVANTILKYGGSSGLDALIAAGEQHKSPFDPAILRMVRWQDPDVTANKVTPSDRFVQLASEINAWSSDPANLDRMREIRSENESKGESAISIAIAREVLGGRRGDFDVYRDQSGLHDPNDLGAVMQQFKLIQEKYKMGVGLSGIDKLPAIRNMSDEEQNAYFWNLAVDAHEAQIQQQRDAQAKQDVGLANQAAIRLQKELGVGPAAAAAAVKAIAKAALTRATRRDGSVDRAMYEQEYNAAVQEAIDGTKQ
jgi:hypothetical protein